MERLQLYRSLARGADNRILYYVIDGLGGVPMEPGGPTELEAAATPTLDRLARTGACGLATPVLPGVTPGSGPAHLALFGFDPQETTVGRGILSALGIGLQLRPGDVAARINLCTLDESGQVVDRRAGRLPDEAARPLVERLDGLALADDVECIVRHVKEYRACLVLRGPDLGGRVTDTDPQATGVPPRDPEPLDDASRRTAALAARFVELAVEALEGEAANGVLLRGFDAYRPLPALKELYGLRAAAVAAYPMYRGVAGLVGMRVFEAAEGPEGLASAAREAAREHDFVYVHYKPTDSRGEDGDFEAKVAEIEKADALAAALLEDAYDVVMVTGDHSTPAVLASHSWHPVPVLIWGGACRGTAPAFNERACLQGELGSIRSLDVLPLVLAHAGRLGKFGA